jgi:hypothetical protein
MAHHDERKAHMRAYAHEHPRERTQPIDYFVTKNAERRQRLRAFLQAQKVGKVCARCGMDDWRVLDFHHLDPGAKEGEIAHAVSRNWSERRIAEEIAKCRVLCANCHRIVHWEQQHGEANAPGDGASVPCSADGG